MRDKRGVILLCFDLPVKTNPERKAYRDFKKHLLSHGFKQFQKSVYVLLVHNLDFIYDDISKIKSYAPAKGTISTFTMSLSHFAKMASISGKTFDLPAFSDNVIVL